MAMTAKERRVRAGRYTVGGWFAIAAVVLLVLAAIAIAGGVVAISNLNDARTRVVQYVDPASRRAAELVVGYLDQETGVRGYALTGQDRFLAPYEAGRRAAAEESDVLRQRIASLDSPELDAQLAAVLAAGRAWSSGYAEPTVARVRADGAQTGTAQADLGKEAFDRFRTAVGVLQDRLTVERQQSRADLDAAADRLVLTIVAVGLLFLLGAVGVLVALRRIVTRPIDRLATRTRRVAGGAFDEAVEADGPRDIAALGGDIESMRARIVHDLTVVEEARVALERQGRELERSNAELEQFAYVASHDLQEPLRKVASFTQLLQKRYGDQLDERADQYIGFAVDGATRMQALINDLLAFSRVGRLAAEDATVFSADRALDRALAALEEAVADSGAVVEREPLPDVRGEESLISAVFQNLVGNAIKFRDPDVAPRIRIAVRRDDAAWEFTCHDNGIGVEPEYAERIFMIFQRLHPKDVFPGTGIGLAMCRKIVEYHGGRIWLDRHATDGSTFHFTLPALSEAPHVPAR